MKSMVWLGESWMHGAASSPFRLGNPNIQHQVKSWFEFLGFLNRVAARLREFTP